jgi:hypothetical protein
VSRKVSPKKIERIAERLFCAGYKVTSWAVQSDYLRGLWFAAAWEAYLGGMN